MKLLNQFVRHQVDQQVQERDESGEVAEAWTQFHDACGRNREPDETSSLPCPKYDIPQRKSGDIRLSMSQLELRRRA
jgi:hypothetical protein